VAVARGVSLAAEPGEPLPVLADSDRVVQVLWNLIGNAVKFTDAGGEVRVSAGSGRGEQWFAVADNGVGIAPEHQPYVFDRFRQVAGDRRGVGLGLPIARGIVEAHGGRIWLESRLGEGTTVRFTLPAISVDDWRTALQGVGAALSNAAIALAQFAVGLLASAYVLFYLLRDGPRCTAWLERRLPLRPGLLRVLISSAALQFRRYVLGTTVIAVLDAVVITAGAVALDLPLIATIAVLTFFAAFVPYVGAWISAVYAESGSDDRLTDCDSAMAATIVVARWEKAVDIDRLRRTLASAPGEPTDAQSDELQLQP